MQFSFLRKDLFWQKSLEPCVKKFAISHKLSQFYCCQLVVSQLKKFPKNLKSPKIIIFGCTRFFGNVCCLFNCLKAFLYFFILFLLSFYTISCLFFTSCISCRKNIRPERRSRGNCQFFSIPSSILYARLTNFPFKMFSYFLQKTIKFFFEKTRQFFLDNTKSCTVIQTTWSVQA